MNVTTASSIISSIKSISDAKNPFAVLNLWVSDFDDIEVGNRSESGGPIFRILTERLRGAVLESDSIFYAGKNQFTIICSSFDSVENIPQIANQICKAMELPLVENHKENHLTCSLGISIYPFDSKRADELYLFSQIAMQKSAMLRNKNNQFYSFLSEPNTSEKISIFNEFQRAINSKEFELCYQPKADLKIGNQTGVEAFLRWNHSIRKEVPPSIFIPIAESVGFMVTLGEWIVRQICIDIHYWMDERIIPPCVSINISPQQLGDLCFSDRLLELLSDSEITASHISLEITESTLLDTNIDIDQAIANLKSKGFILSLDDFGTGYSALNNLKRFPFDFVKIDQTFIQQLPGDVQDAAITKAVISMAHNLGMEVIAEGVETEMQCKFLRDSMCDQIQGDFFSKPLNAEGISNFFKGNPLLANHLLALKKPDRALLLVDDEPNILNALKRLFRRDNYKIYTAESGHEGLTILKNDRIDVIISDQRMPVMTGVDFLRTAKELYPDTVRIILSGYTELQYITDAINEGAIYKFLTKPWDDELLRTNIRGAFQHKEMEDENRRLNIQIQTTNQELVRSNLLLADMLKRKESQISRDEISLNIVREALQFVPAPIFGIDDEDTIVFVNHFAEKICSNYLIELGANIKDAIPEISFGIDEVEEEGKFNINIFSSQYVVYWKKMGGESKSAGKIIVFLNALI